jgi:hypothetical protein
MPRTLLLWRAISAWPAIHHRPREAGRHEAGAKRVSLIVAKQRQVGQTVGGGSERRTPIDAPLCDVAGKSRSSG